MNVESAVMKMDRFEARHAYVNYPTAIREKKATKDDVALYRGLKAMLRGQRVLDINLAIGSGGIDTNGRPKLAICRADASACHLHGFGDKVRFSSRQDR